MKIKDIAMQAGVSMSTVSRVLNHSDNVSKATEQKVRDALEKIQTFSGSGTNAPDSGSTHKILAIVPTFSNSFYSLVFKGILNTCNGAGWNVFICVTEYSNVYEKQYLSMLTSGQADGVVAFYSHLPIPYLEEIASRFPYIQIGDQVDSPVISSVSIDDVRAAYEATEFLIKKGHHRIGMLSDHKFCASRREMGFRQAKQVYGVSDDQTYIVKADYQYDSGFEYDSGISGCERLLRLPEPPTAFLTTFDTFAVGVSKCCLSHGLTPGKDVAVVGFDNTAISKAFMPSITTVSHPRYEMGCLAANILLDQIETGRIEAKKIILPHELIVREST